MVVREGRRLNICGFAARAPARVSQISHKRRWTNPGRTEAGQTITSARIGVLQPERSAQAKSDSAYLTNARLAFAGTGMPLCSTSFDVLPDPDIAGARAD